MNVLPENAQNQLGRARRYAWAVFAAGTILLLALLTWEAFDVRLGHPGEADSDIQRKVLVYGLLWLTGMGGIFTGWRRFRRGYLQIEQQGREQAYTLLQSTIDRIDVPVMVIGLDYRIQMMNEGIRQHYAPGSAPDTQFLCYQLSHGHESPCSEHSCPCPLVRVQETLLPVTTLHEHVTAEGEKRMVEVTVAPLLDERGALTSVVETARDITERKQAEVALREYSERLEEMVKERTQELRDAQEQLLRREKLAVLGQLAGGIAHDLRNPLGAISNAAYFLNLVLEEPGPEVKEMLEILNKEVRTSERIIRSLLDFARTKAPVRREVDLNAVVRRALTHADVPESVEVVSRLDEELPTIQADPDQLAQVFDNIIRNAVQAMPAGGQLSVISEQLSVNSDQSPISNLQSPVSISFTDTGVGIPEENLGKLFEPLFTTKAKGIGLGLALTKMLVEGHGGTIEVESEVGKGSTFTVRLPIYGE